MGCCADRRFRRGAIVLAALLAPAAAHAQQPESFTARVAAAVAQRWGVPAARVHIEWERNAPEHGGSFTLEGGAAGEWVVSTTGQGDRANYRLRAGVLQECPSAARDLPRAVTLASDHITRSTVTRWGPPVSGGCADVEGWVTRRPVRMGEPLEPPAVAPPAAVRSGEKVRVTFVRGSVAVTLDGRAAGSGAVGDRILVHMETGRRVMTTITGAGSVEVREIT